MPDAPFEPADRRPIPQRDQAFWKGVAQRCVDAGFTGNGISLAGMVAAVLAGACLLCTPHAGNAWAVRGLFLAAALLMPLRLVCNMLDGMVAILRGEASPVGAVMNEVPDRVSDVAALVGLGHAVGGSPGWGWAAAVGALFVAYVRAAVRVAGAPECYAGPMAKQQRMAVAAAACGVMAVAPGWGAAWSVPAWALGLIAAGCVATAARRLGIGAARLRAGAGA